MFLCFASTRLPLTQSATTLNHFVFSSVGSQTAGTSFNVTITAVDFSGTKVASYTGTPTLTYSAGSITPSTTTNFSLGVWMGSVRVTTAGTNVTITASDGGHTGTSNSFTVNAAASSNILISPIDSSLRAGSSLTFSATATDAYGNTWDATSSTIWNISDGAGGSWSGNVYTSEVSGSWTVTGTYGSAAYTTSLTVIPLWALSISPDQGLAGTVVDVSGIGFAANASVTISFGDSAVTTAYVDDSGNVNAEFNVPSVSAGSYVVNATDDAGGSATASFTVTSESFTSTSLGSGSTSTGTTTTTTTPTSTATAPSPTPYTPTPSRSPSAVPTYQPTNPPTAASSEFWSPLTLGIIAVVLIAFSSSATVLYARRGSRKPFIDEERPPYTPQYPSTPDGYAMAPRYGQPPYPSQQATSTVSPSRYSPPPSYMYSQQTSRPYATARPYQSQSYSRPSSYATCPRCRHAVSGNLNVCPYCGNRLR